MVGIKKVEKGDVLIKEGESSASMYWLQKGQMRLFKKKGNGFIELGVLHAGELVGEMSFLDNEPRSASVEAMTTCDLIEIPRGKFDEVMQGLPSWLNSLVQTLVKRMRASNNRLREIESASTVYVKNAEGKTEKQHEFISINELLRLCSALVLSAVRKGEAGGNLLRVKSHWLHIYGGNIMNVPVAKVVEFLDVLADAGVVQLEKTKEGTTILMNSVDFLDRFVQWANDENLKPDDKRLPLTVKGITICDMIYQYGNLQSFGNQEQVDLNVEATYRAACEALQTKLPFEMTSWKELIDSGLAGELVAGGNGQKVAKFNLARFRALYPFLNLRQRFIDLNEAKRGQS